MLGTFPKDFSQVATFQMFNFPSGNFPKVRLGPLRRRRLQWGPIAAARMREGPKTMARTGWDRALRLGQTCQVAAWEISFMGRCHLGKYPWEKSFGKVPNF